MGASNNIILHLCDAVDQPSANMFATLCPRQSEPVPTSARNDTSERVTRCRDDTI